MGSRRLSSSPQHGLSAAMRNQGPCPGPGPVGEAAMINRSASVVELRQDRQPSDTDPDGWSRAPSRLRPGLEESLVTTMTSVLSLMEEVARIQRETTEVLRALTARSGNGAAVQRLRRPRTRSKCWSSFRTASRLSLAGKEGGNSGPGVRGSRTPKPSH
jgi:hypothetical protein